MNQRARFCEVRDLKRKMIKLRFIFFSLLLVLPLWSSASPDDIPGLAADSVQHDFGAVELGTTSRARFKIRANAAAVVILSAATNCECTKAAYPKKPLRSGEEGVIEVSFEARERGYFRKTVHVTYHTGAKPRTLTLTVTGNVS